MNPRWRVPTALLIVVVGVVSACSGGSGSHSSATTALRTAVPRVSTTQLASALPPVDIDGVPLRRLARLARSIAALWSERHPFNMRVAIGSDRAANALMGTGEMTYNFGSTSRAYVVVLDGHFACRPPRCAGSEFFRSTATAAPTATNITPISTLVLTVHPKSLELTGLRAVRHRVDLASLGKTYSLSA